MSGILKPQLWAKDDIIKKGLTELWGWDRMRGSGELPNPTQGQLPGGWLLGWLVHKDGVFAKILHSMQLGRMEGKEGKENHGIQELVLDLERRPQFQTILLFSNVNRKLFLPLYRSVPPLHWCCMSEQVVFGQDLTFHFMTTSQCCRDVTIWRLK